ncbi:MAG: acyl carrier protein [Bacteroidales bacterium]|jgi:acyl carrier protein|nr:acyl carrier protein [Bacteroidales bacterium]
MRKLDVYEVLDIINSILHSRADEDKQKKEPITLLTKEQIETDFSELNIDSITFISIVVSLENEYELEIPDEYLLMTEMNSINKIHQVLKEVTENICTDEDATT